MYGDHILPDLFSTFFMFPFSLNSNIVLNDYQDALKSRGWQEDGYKITHGIDYNEYVYFYPYIRDILFNRKDASESTDINGVTFFRYPLSPKESYFSVDVISNNANFTENNYNLIRQRTIKLPLKNIFLHLFEVGVGILIFEIVHDARFLSEKSEPYSVTDYLRFMEAGRRIFVPFVNGEVHLENNLTIGKHQLAKPKNSTLSARGYVAGLDAVRKSLIAEKVIVQTGNKTVEADYLNEPFLLESNNKYKPALSRLITDFLDAGSFTYENDTYKSIIDERMFVHAYFSIGDAFTYKQVSSDGREKTIPSKNHQFLEGLKEAFKYGLDHQKINEVTKLWYQMIFLDWQEPSCQNPRMIKELLEESTYVRWSGYGGFSGFSRFSSVMISNINQAGFIYNHFQSIYYQIAILLLFYRGAILNFSDRSEYLSNRIHDLPSNQSPNRKERKAIKEILKEADRLNKEFLLFRNKFWFREVTAQDQGIEIFDLWSKQMRNKELLQDAESEIHTLFEFIDSMNEKNISKKINILTIIGGIFLPVALVTSFFGMNFIFLKPGSGGAQGSWMVEQLKNLLHLTDLSIPFLEFGVFIVLLILLFLLEFGIYKLLERKV